MYKILRFKSMIFYCIFLSILCLIFFYDYKTEINNYLEENTHQTTLKYNSIYELHKDIADIIFTTQIDIDEIINLYQDINKQNELEKNITRERLLSKLNYKYKKLKLFNIKQLHFHLPDNTSFLRFHRPKKFGDDLSSIRQTVKYVNKHKKSINGFEEGRIFNGFRFVYPLFDKNSKHLGSVEISFSASAFIDKIKQTYNLDSNFIIKKDVVNKKVFEEEKKNYVKSNYKDFYYEKSILDTYSKNNIKDESEDFTIETLKGKPFSVFLKKSNIIKTLIPLKNPVTKESTAVLFIYKKDNYILYYERRLYLFFTIILIMSTLIFLLFYKEIESNRKLKALNKSLDKKIKFEIVKSRKKDLQILNQSRMSSITEVLNNIAHQWRQPLNIISTSASGLKLHKEVGTLDDDNFELLTNSINKYSQYLSETIETFTDYLNQEEIYKTICIQDRIEKVLKMTKNSFEYSNITILQDLQIEKLYIDSLLGDLSQVILNILNNSKDALLKNNKEDNRSIGIKVRSDLNNIIIIIQDNAGGIPLDIIDKIFEPYFTTKHKYLGTGIGLYISYEIITKRIKGIIKVENTDCGARFIIEIPKKK